jgi:alpha-1,2-mannosyltransferase
MWGDVSLLSVYLWITIFSLQPHKEERFMYVVYPLICYNAARALTTLVELLSRLTQRLNFASSTPRLFPSLFWLIVVILFVLLSLGRILAQLRAYSAPMHMYGNIARAGVVCLGKEWYRFPSSFFVPLHSRPAFIKSDFDGLLPGSFEENGDLGWRSGMWRIPGGMNDENLPEPSHVV